MYSQHVKRLTQNHWNSLGRLGQNIDSVDGRSSCSCCRERVAASMSEDIHHPTDHPGVAHRFDHARARRQFASLARF